MRFIFIIYIIFLVACNNNARDPILDQFDSINRSLEKVQAADDSQIIRLYEALGVKESVGAVSSPLSDFRAGMSSFYVYIDDLESDFKKFCGGDRDKPLSEKDGNNAANTNGFFVTRAHARELWDKINSLQGIVYKTAKFDSVKAGIKGLFDILTKEGNKDSFVNDYFKDDVPVMAISNMNSIRNNMRHIERMTLLDIMNNNFEILKNSILPDTTK